MTWGKALIRDVASFVMGQAPPGTEVNEIGLGTPFFRSGEFEDIRPKIVAWTTKPLRLALPTDVFVCVVGANAGEVNRGADGAIGRSIGAVRSGDRMDHDYLYYFLRSIEVYLRNAAQGSAQAVISKDDLGRIEIPLPVLEEQRAIAGVLGALDDKIESNRRVTATIEKLVPLIFQSMTAESELKPLPEVAKLQKGISYRSVDLEHSETAMVTLKSYDRNGGYKSNGLKPYIGKYKPEQVLLPGDMAVAQTDLTQGAEVVGRVIRIPRQEDFETLVASLDLVIVRPLDAADKNYLYGALLQEDFREHCRSRTSGTTVLHLGSDAIPKYSIPWADGDVRKVFSDEVQPLLEEHDSLTKESTSLKRLSDALLPEMLSGRLRVKEAESMMENV